MSEISDNIFDEFFRKAYDENTPKRKRKIEKNSKWMEAYVYNGDNTRNRLS